MQIVAQVVEIIGSSGRTGTLALRLTEQLLTMEYECYQRSREERTGGFGVPVAHNSAKNSAKPLLETWSWTERTALRHRKPDAQTNFVHVTVLVNQSDCQWSPQGAFRRQGITQKVFCRHLYASSRTLSLWIATQCDCYRAIEQEVSNTFGGATHARMVGCAQGA
jgi:hypothetical protein